MQEPQKIRIAGLLYDGILSPADWHAGMSAFCEAVGGVNFHQLTVDLRQSQVLESVATLGNPKAVEEYDRHYALVDERVPVVTRLGQGQLMLDHEHFSERHMSRSELYTQCLAPQGMKYCMGLVLRVEGSVQQHVGFMRALDRPQFSDDERRFALHLVPEVMRAARLRARTAQLAQQAAFGLAALDALPQAIALVDAHCRVQHCNAAADRLLCTPGAIQMRHGRLECQESTAQAQWQCIVSAACMRQGTGMAGTLIAKSVTRSLVVTVLPIHAHHPAALQETPMALVVLHDPDAPQGLDPRLTADMLGLSPTETRLALLIASGKTIKDFAAAEGVSWHTARTHIKNLLRKTGCRRQVEIAALLRSLRVG